MIITGIGSRETPAPILAELEKIGKWVLDGSHVGRSGHAEGADYAFERGAQKACQVFLPWAGFNSEFEMLGQPKLTQDADLHFLNELVRKYHRATHKLKRGGWALMRRNCCQILGEHPQTPVLSDAVVYWAPGNKGGTGFAIRMAQDIAIPLIPMHEERFATAELVIAELERLYGISLHQD